MQMYCWNTGVGHKNVARGVDVCPFLSVVLCTSVLWGFLSPLHGASSGGCGWRRWPPDLESTCYFIE
jgi:hypothetical protein